MSEATDAYLDPELHNPEHPCRTCGRHQGECGGPPIRCCEACTHWTPLSISSDEPVVDCEEWQTRDIWVDFKNPPRTGANPTAERMS